MRAVSSQKGEFVDITYLWFFILLLPLALSALRYIRIGNYEPEKVLQDLGNNVCVNYSGIANKTVQKRAIAKIQRVGNCVSLFNKSDNALDIHIPKKAWADNIFARAKIVFPHAEVVEIDY
jgi:hypothetical protein